MWVSWANFVDSSWNIGAVVSVTYFAYKRFSVFLKIRFQSWRNAMKNENVNAAVESKETTDILCYSDQIWWKCCDSWLHTRRDFLALLFLFGRRSRVINGNVFSTTYPPSLVPSGGLKFPLFLRFQSPKYVTHCITKTFLQTLYNRSILVLRLMLAMKNPRRKSVFQLMKGNISEK